MLSNITDTECSQARQDIRISARGSNNKELFKDIKLIFGVNAVVDFADSRLTAYFYDVEPEYTTPERNYYESDSG